MRSSNYLILKLIMVFSPLSVSASAENIESIIKFYENQVKKTNPKFTAFSKEAGKTFYFKKNENKEEKGLSCASCHTDDPTKKGKHHTTGKSIDPMAPSKNQERFTDKAKVEKWFKRNCNDVFKRECSAQEKGDFIVYLKSL